MPTGRVGSAFSSVSQVPGMNRLNVAAQLAGGGAAAEATAAQPMVSPAVTSAVNRQRMHETVPFFEFIFQ
ncbi:hypothetical protein Ntsu_34360 [Nocardia sp. IFM 10818]